MKNSHTVKMIKRQMQTDNVIFNTTFRVALHFVDMHIIYIIVIVIPTLYPFKIMRVSTASISNTRVYIFDYSYLY